MKERRNFKVSSSVPYFPLPAKRSRKSRCVAQLGPFDDRPVVTSQPLKFHWIYNMRGGNMDTKEIHLKTIHFIKESIETLCLHTTLSNYFKTFKPVNPITMSARSLLQTTSSLRLASGVRQPLVRTFQASFSTTHPLYLKESARGSSATPSSYPKLKPVMSKLLNQLKLTCD